MIVQMLVAGMIALVGIIVLALPFAVLGQLVSRHRARRAREEAEWDRRFREYSTHGHEAPWRPHPGFRP